MNPSEDKVDLSSVNKTKKQFKLPKIKNPFKSKSAGPGRDEFGQFKSGSGGLLSHTKFNLKRAVPLAIVVSLVGGFFVFRSFASVTPPPSYQYSLTDSTKSACRSTTKELKGRLCHNKSAEAMVFRLYKGVTNKSPDNTGYQYWVQRLAGNRQKATTLAESLTTQKSVSSLSNKQYIENMYKQFNGQAGDKSGIEYWVNQLNGKDWSRGRVAAHFAIQDRAISAQNEAFANFLGAAPKVKVLQTAKTEQKTRLKSASDQVAIAKRTYEASTKFVNSSRANRDSAKKIAAKSVSSKEDLQAIGSNEKTVRTNLTNAQRSNTTIKSVYQKVNALSANAAEVTSFSPDISDSAIKNELSRALAYRNGGDSVVSDLNNLIKDISGQYKIAEGKYQAEQKRRADAATLQAKVDECKRNGGTWNGSCKEKAKPAASTSSSATGGGSGSSGATQSDSCSGAKANGKCYYDRSTPTCPTAQFTLAAAQYSCIAPNKDPKYTAASKCPAGKQKVAQPNAAKNIAYCYKVK